MKSGNVILLTLLIGSKLIYSCFWQINFYINQLEITRLECENKDKPLMKCNGKCYLAKQLQKADNELDLKKSEQEKSKNKLKTLELSFFVSPAIIDYSLRTKTVSNSESLFNFQDNLPEGFTSFTFHPPCLS
jgi:hypothetical protein